MLVLSRKAGEQIVLPELGITVTVLRISGNKSASGHRRTTRDLDPTPRD